MNLVEAKINIPANMLPWIVEDEYLSVTDRNAMLLYPLVKKNVLSHGKAADILGISKSELIDLYAKLGMSYFTYSIDDVNEEVSHYKQLKGI